MSKFILDQDMNRHFSILEEFQKSNFSTISIWNVLCFLHLNLGIAIVQDAIFDKLNSFWRKLTIQESVFSRILNLVSF